MILRLLILLIIFAVFVVPPVDAFDRQEFERRRAEHKRRMDEMKRKMRNNRSNSSWSNSNTSRNKTNSSYSQRSRSNSYSTRSKRTSKKFDPKRAPSPKQCFLKFIQTVKSATSMKQVLPYYSTNLRDNVEISQSRYSPADEARKKKLFGKSYAAHKGDSYTTSLRHIKSIVAKTKKIKDVGSKGNRAGVEVYLPDGSTGNYSFVGEDNYWKYNGYKRLTMRVHSK